MYSGDVARVRDSIIATLARSPRCLLLFGPKCCSDRPENWAGFILKISSVFFSWSGREVFYCYLVAAVHQPRAPPGQGAFHSDEEGPLDLVVLRAAGHVGYFRIQDRRHFVVVLRV